RERRALDAVKLDRARRDVAREPRAPAAAAAPLAEVAHVGRRVQVGAAVDDAELRVGRVLQSGAGLRAVVDPVGSERAVVVARELAEERVVDVGHEHRVAPRPERIPPAPGDELELAVAMELVAEEIAEKHSAWMHPPHDFRQRALVYLEEAELR